MLGRADDARSFIMNGKEIAFIEVELTPHPGQPTHIFQRKIDRNKGSERGNGRGASTCYINDEKVSLKDIQKVVKETYHISIDNLCTFLPQDKVGNFSGFDQQSLLLETEKTLSGTQHLYHAHQQLIEKESELNSGDNDVDTLVEKINKLTTERDRFEREKARMEERNQAVAQKELLEKKIGWLDFNEKRIYVQGLRDKKNEYKEKLNQVKAEVAPLEEKQEALQKREHDLAKEFKAHDTNIQKKKKDMANHHSKGDKLDENIDQALADLESIGAEKAQKKKAYEQQAHKVESLKAQRDGLPPAEEIESAFKEASQKKQATHKDLQAAKKVCHNLHSKFGEFETKAEQLSSKLAKLQDEKARRRERVLAGHDNLRKIMQWLEKNRKNFRRKVWGPIACELAPRSANAAAFLNEHVANATLKSFVVEDKSDYDLLYNEIRNGLSIPINITVVKNGVLEPIQRMYSESKMKKLKEKHGIIGYLDESFTAPDAVMQALINSSRVHQVLVGGPETQKSIDDRGLLRYLSEPDTELGQNKPQSSCVFASEGQRSRKYTTQISRYSKKPNTNIDDIGPARMLAPGVDPKKRDQLKDQLKSIHDEMAVLRPQLEDADGNKAKLEEKGQELGRLAASKKEDMETYNKVRTKLSQAESKLADLEKDLKADDSKKKREQIRKIMNSVQNLVRAVEQHGTCHDKMIDSTTKCAGKRIDKDTVTQLFRETT